MKQFILGAGLLVGAFILTAPMQAGTITNIYAGALPTTINGALPNQGTALLEVFTLPTAGDVTLTTSSYATGGFQTNLELFNSTGNFVAAGSPSGTADPSTGIIGDSTLTTSVLPAGMYTVALTDFLLNQSITATNLSDGFTTNFGDGVNFIDNNGNTRTANYSLTISAAAASSSVPEPATLWLAAPILVALALQRRSARKHSSAV